MSLSQPVGPNARSAVAANQAIVAAARERGSALNVLMAETRWEGLQLNVKEYSRLVGLDAGTLQRLERSPTPPDIETADRILSFWRSQGLPPLTIDRAARLCAQDNGRNVGQFFRRLALVVGMSNFERDAEMGRRNLTKLVHRPCPYGLSRGQGLIRKVLPVDSPLREQLLQEYTLTWRNHMKGFLTQTGAPAPMVQLHLAVREHELSQVRIKGILVTAGVRARDGITRLFHFQPVPWVVAEPLAAILFPPNELSALKSRWMAEVEPQTQRKSFAQGVRQGKETFGLSNAIIAEALGVRKTWGISPAEQVNRMLRGYAEMFYIAPPALVAFLVTTGGKPPTRLQSLQAISLAQRLYKDRALVLASAKPRLPRETIALRLTRESWGVSAEQLAVKIGAPFTALSIEALERGKLRSTRTDRDNLRAAVFEIGQARLDVALQNLRAIRRRATTETRRQLDPKTAANLARFAAARAGGFQKLSLRTRNDDRSMRPSDEVTLSKIAKGEIVPSLPVLARIAHATDISLSPHVRADWQLQFPAYLHRTIPQFATDIRSRALRTLIAQRYPSVRHCARDLFSDLPERQITHVLRALGRGKANIPSVSHIMPILLERLLLDVPEGQRRFVDQLFERGGDLALAREHFEQAHGAQLLAGDAIGATQAELRDVGVRAGSS